MLSCMLRKPCNRNMQTVYGLHSHVSLLLGTGYHPQKRKCIYKQFQEISKSAAQVPSSELFIMNKL